MKPKSGVCQICGCTEENACRFRTGRRKLLWTACRWVNQQRTLCSAPVCVKAAYKGKK
jgi:hypothetical protein